MTKEELTLEVIRRLKVAYPLAECTLDYDQAWKLLVSVRLAAQCTDARVNVVVEGLYEKYPDVASLAAADVTDIEEIVRPCGLGKSKARDIIRKLKEHGITRFLLLFQGSRSRSEVVATFLAVLELCRAHVLRLAGSETDCTVRQEGELPENLTL